MKILFLQMLVSEEGMVVGIFPVVRQIWMEVSGKAF
jgi:hypothetical protein